MSEQEKKPLLELICEAENKEGRLAGNFRLPAENEKQEKFAMGALDGILMYHTMLRDSRETTAYGQLTRAIDLAAEGKEEEALALVDTFCENSQMLPHVEAVQEYVNENAERLHPQAVFPFALKLFSKGTRREAVKFGMALLELFDTGSMENLKDFIRYIGACNEFTLYAVYLMKHWENGNEEIFRAARKVRGWGRIFAIEYLEPETPEIRKWLIAEGVHNRVMPHYSALTVALKSDLLHRMREEMTMEEYMGMIDIVAALLNEGPVPGISGMKDADKFMEAFDESLLQNGVLLRPQMTKAQADKMEAIRKIRSGK